MNKILRYSLSLAFAIVASATFAAEPYKVLTFPDDNKANNQVGAYDKTWEAKMGDDTWQISNFNNNKWNNWNYIKCGRKNVASVATITSPVIDEPIGYVVVTIDKITSDKVNCITLKCNGVNTSIGQPGNLDAGDLTIDVYPMQQKANSIYTLEFECLAGSSNGLIQVSKIALYKVGDKPTKVDISNTPETAYTVAKAKELIDAGEGLATQVYVKGIVSQASKSLDANYGSLSYYISDNGETDDELQVYGGLSFNGEKFTSVDDIKVGDKVVVYGTLKKYGQAYELDKNNVLISKDSTPTGISNIALDAAAENAPAYNLAGQQVSKAYKGVVIKAGKKYVQK